MDSNQTISLQPSQIIFKLPEENKQNPLDFLIPVSCPQDDEEPFEKIFSPSKYFGKCPSFEYKNLKSIERTTHRALSAIHKLEENEKSPLNKTLEENNSQVEMENSKVHFSAQIIEDDRDDKDAIISPIEQKPTKKPKKSILKKTHYNEEITLDKIFKNEINGQFTEKISLECGKECKHFSEKLSKCFVDHWKTIGQDPNALINCLQVVIEKNFSKFN